jgi:hypothetical protein
MIENCNFPRQLLRRIAIAASVVFLATVPYSANAQTDANTANASDNGHQYSSSTDWKSYLAVDGDGGSPGGTASASPQYGQSSNRPGYRYPDSSNRWSHLAIEAGAGFTAPIGNDVSGGKGLGLSGYDTWGYNVTAGAGWNFTKRFGALLEYQFNRNKIPGGTLAAISDGNSVGSAIGGNINTWSFTIDPIIYQPFTKTMGGYVTGGGGFYRKVTNFTEPVVECDFFECFNVPETVAHFSSNQGGLNIGIGFYKKFAEDSNAKFYAEARYVWVDSPAASASNGFNAEGSEGLIPVTFGIRF